MLLAGGDSGFLDKRSQVLPDMFRRDTHELESAFLTPGEKLGNGVAIGATGVLIPDRPVEKLLSGEDDRLAGAVDNVRQLTGDELTRSVDRNQCPAPCPSFSV